MQRRIAVIAPPWYPLPPHGYGGIELVVALLVEGLRSAGDDVTVFGAGGSSLDVCELAPPGWHTALGTPEEQVCQLTYAARVAPALQRLGPFDVVHDHCGMATLLLAAHATEAPVVHTVHGVIGAAGRDYLAALPPRVGLIAISATQQESAPELRWLGTVHNAVDINALRVASRSEKEPYLLCLARICPDKGQHLAIEVARRAGMRLVLAGKIEASDQGREYFDRFVAPVLDGDSVVHVENAAGSNKARLLSGATALLAPLQWDEPFGLSLVEAMASGTPVISFPRGAAPELVEEGVTGFIVGDVTEMAEAVAAAHEVDPQRCAAVARSRFSPEAMTAAYRCLYDAAVASGRSSAATGVQLRGAPRFAGVLGRDG